MKQIWGLWRQSASWLWGRILHWSQSRGFSPAIGDIMAIKQDMGHYCTTLTYWMRAQLGRNWDRNLYSHCKTLKHGKI